MKVLQIVKTNEGATWAFVQAKWLFDNGIDVVTVLPSINGGMSEQYKDNGMKVVKGDFSLPITNPFLFVSKAMTINNLVDQIKPDIVHCHFVTNIMMIRLALRKSKIPRLFQVPGPLHLESKFFRKAEIILARHNDFWAGACKKTCDVYLASGISKEKVYLAYYGGYDGKACNDRDSQNKLHQEYAIPSDKVLIGMIAYFYKPKYYLFQFRGIKGHEDFIDAIALVQKKYPSVIGIVIGDAWGNSKKYVRKVKKYADKKCKGGIIFTGFRTDIKEIYRELDIAVHPSLSENLGGAAESLAAGTPTISTNVGGFPDIVKDGKTGLLVPPSSPKDLSLAIIKMIENPQERKEMAEAGKPLVRETCDIEKTAKRILEIYEEILLKK